MVQLTEKLFFPPDLRVICAFWVLSGNREGGGLLLYQD